MKYLDSEAIKGLEKYKVRFQFLPKSFLFFIKFNKLPSADKLSAIIQKKNRLTQTLSLRLSLQYNSIDSSPLSNYVMHPFWNQLVKVSRVRFDRL